MITNEIVMCINDYERRLFGSVEANCLNLARKYDNNDNTAQGFLVAIRNQEHWNGENFEEIAKELIKIDSVGSSKIARYLIIRSIDCTMEMLEEIFDPAMYSRGELQEIARVANSSRLLELIFAYVKQNIGRVTGYTILCCAAGNVVADSKLCNELYAFDKRLSAQMFLKSNSKASTELLMKMFYECDDELKDLLILQLVHFDRTEINEHLRSYLLNRLIQIFKNVN